MIPCDPRAIARCKDNKVCGDHPCFSPDSECEKFNQKVTEQPPTNADRIRTMTNKKLAEWFQYSICHHIHCNAACFSKDSVSDKEKQTICHKKILAWLKQKAKD